jgi:hypothetical protein
MMRSAHGTDRGKWGWGVVEHDGRVEHVHSEFVMARVAWLKRYG